MNEIKYLDFDLEIDRTATGYRSRVLVSPGGTAEGDFTLPFSDLEMENFLLRLGRRSRAVRRLESPEQEAARMFGGKLFSAVPADVRACLRSSLDEADRQGKGLRIRLHLMAVPELYELPWEYLYNSSLNRFLALSSKTPVVRFLDLPERIRRLEVTAPLRVLAVISSPSDEEPLDVEREWANLQKALGPLQQRGLVVLERLETASLAVLQRRLRTGQFHVLHFVGHGGYDAQAQDGVLVFTDERGRARRVSGNHLGMILHDHASLRLAILNACEGARASRREPFAGVAQSLVQQGIPAVIAMQFEVTDEAAIAFAQDFYAAIADGYPVDGALAESRKTLFAIGNEIEWGTPVLYTRVPDGRIFDISADLHDSKAVMEEEERERRAREKAEADKIEQERLAQQKIEQERLAREKAEAERVARQQAEQERLARDKIEQERLAQQKIERERLEKERGETERNTREKAEQERLARQEVEAESVARQQAEKERAVALDKIEQERLAQQKIERERLEKERQPRPEPQPGGRASILKWIGVSAGVLLLLWVVIGRPQTGPPSTTPTSAAISTAGIVFNDDFTSVAESKAKGWLFGNDEYKSAVEGQGWLAITAKRVGFYSVYGPDGNYLDFGAEVDAQATSGDPAYGLFIRSDYLVPLEGYLFVVQTDNTYYLRKTVNGKFSEGNSILVGPSTSPYLTDGRSRNRLGVLAKDSSISLFINGHQVNTITDSAITKRFNYIQLYVAGRTAPVSATFYRLTVLWADRAAREWNAP